jgi:threonine aldolase
MFKYNFQNDYSEGAHPRILEALTRTNLVQELGYGEDSYCLQAADLIRTHTGNQKAEVHFVSGGTQANLICLSSMLKSFESVIAVNSGHICVHETGSIEATGHKIHSLPGQAGKITLPEIEAVVTEHYFEHMVRPRVVYISQSTELGTIYSAKELGELSALCKKLNLYLYLDGARLGTALASAAADLTMAEISTLVDAFYIGGTKNGALVGEAVVINNPELQADFRYHIKQRGGLLSKGRLLGIQFQELFRDGLYLDLARHANQMAQKLTEGISALGYSFFTDSPTNQIFPIFPDSVIQQLETIYRFYTWMRINSQNMSVRLVTSWSTPEAAIDEFLVDLKKLG